MALRNDVRDEMASEWLGALKEGRFPWRGPYVRSAPYNPVSGTRYTRTNRAWLSYGADKKGYSDPRWCTFKQAKSRGWSVRKGEKAMKVEFFSKYDTLTKKKLSDREACLLREQMGGREYNERVRPIASHYYVFNAEQMEGVPELGGEFKPWDAGMIAGRREALISSMGVGFREGGMPAYYDRGADCISMPAPGNIVSPEAYMATLIHEAGHATMHESRLNRDVGSATKEDRAREELRAEIASAFVSQDLGISSRAMMQDNTAYIRGWITALEDNPGELFSAIADAEEIADYLAERLEDGRENAREAEGKREERKEAAESPAGGGAPERAVAGEAGETYERMMDRHLEERKRYPVVFACTGEQFNAGMRELGLEPGDTGRIVRFGCGFMLAEDAPKLRALEERQEKELEDAIAGDRTGEGFVYGMFKHGLEKVGFACHGDLDEFYTDGTGIPRERIEGDPALAAGLEKAVNGYPEHGWKYGDYFNGLKEARKEPEREERGEERPAPKSPSRPEKGYGGRDGR